MVTTVDPVSVFRGNRDPRFKKKKKKRKEKQNKTTTTTKKPLSEARENHYMEGRTALRSYVGQRAL